MVLIGGSYIGCEVAASLTAKGTDCAIVMMEDVALSRTFGDQAGRWFHELLESKGVEIHGGETLEAFEGDGDVKGGRHRERQDVEGDMVVVGAGVKPDVMLAERAGLEIEDDGGIRLRRDAAELGRGDLSRPVTSARTRAACTVGGCGSSTGTWRCSRGSTLRRRCSATAAVRGQCPTSSATSRTGPASNTWGRRATGTRRSGAGDRDAGEFTVFYLKDGKVAGALTVERSEDLAHARTLLAQGVDVGSDEAKALLADPNSDLAELTQTYLSPDEPLSLSRFPG